MPSNLKDRLKEAMKGPPRVTGVALAKACKVAPPSVSDWLSGRTKTMEAGNLLAAAKLLRVDPDWLATGKGHMRPGFEVREPAVGYLSASAAEHAELQRLIRQLDHDQLRETISFVKWQLANKAPPRHGQALSMAGK